MTTGTLATILIDSENQNGLEPAIQTARRLSLHLDVVCLAQATFHLPPPSMVDAFIPPDVAHNFAEEIAETERAVETRLAGEDIEWSVSGLMAGREVLAHQLIRRIRFADMVQLPRTGPSPADIVQLFEAVLYNSSVPILLSDAGVDTLDHVIVAWDESDVALAAVNAAMPLLSAAKSVEIVTVDKPEAGQDLARMLSRKGVSPRITALDSGKSSVADALMDHAKSKNADLVVAGAYGHARLRELILGGVTRSLLKMNDRALFLAR